MQPVIFNRLWTDSLNVPIINIFRDIHFAIVIGLGLALRGSSTAVQIIQGEKCSNYLTWQRTTFVRNVNRRSQSSGDVSSNAKENANPARPFQLWDCTFGVPAKSISLGGWRESTLPRSKLLWKWPMEPANLTRWPVEHSFTTTGQEKLLQTEKWNLL